ncbi:hypothetical protein F0562_023204 [Nyssa sinensis]|uniref:Myb-like domain-containing protein n=1 Tax=Nyssa sinensis TaxID=561372 RepID=A0A5J5BK23_9ASTE|nr:hypothetical protein F0562_023204 [Nyssa sinensis]
MVPEPNDMHENVSSPTKGVEGQQVPNEGTDDRSRMPRHPRWTRQETLVLIEGKKVAENRSGRSRKCGSVFGSDQLEPKWDSVSSYCKQRGVNRGPVQCRKRWSNLVGDFKKIKTWESQIKEEAESFWMMRNDLKREKKLPGFFDREVYDVLDGRAYTAAAFPLALVAVTADVKDGDGVEAVAEEEDEAEEEEADGVFDSSQHAASKDGLSSDFEQLAQEEIGKSPRKEMVPKNSPTMTVPAPMPISDKQHQPFYQAYSNKGTTKEKQPGSNFWRGSMSQEGWKRRRLSSDGCRDTNLEDRLIKVLERNSDMLSAQLEAHNMNCQLDRDQHKDHNETLVAALSKITDALVRIADRL